MRSDSDGFFRDLVKLAQSTEGWRVEKLKNGHTRFWPPFPGKPVIAGGTAGSSKAQVALRCALRRAGLPIGEQERA